MSDEDGMISPRGPLGGVTVVDLTRALAGPHAAMMLGDLGATVFKVENPGSGDDTRGWGPPFVGEGDQLQSTYFLSCNRNKLSIALDLKDADDLQTLRDMIAGADVLLENFRPGTMERLGLGPNELHRINPKLVALSISGFGHDGPEGGRAGYDQIAQGEAGLMSLTGSRPDDAQRTGVPIGDLLAGIYGAFGILAALRERDVTGRGQIVRTSLLAAIVGVHAFQGTRWTVAGEVGTAQGNHHPSLAPYGLFRTCDGAVQVAVGSEPLWRQLCAVIAFDPETPGFESNRARVRNREELISLLEGSFAHFTSSELLAALTDAGIPCGKIRSIDEVYEWEQTLSQNLLIEVAHPTLGPVRLPGPPLRFFSPEGQEQTRSDHLAPPLLDEHRQRVLDWLRERNG